MNSGIATGIMGGALWLAAGLAAAEVVDFDRQIRPILAENCFHCHGPDPTTRKAGLRLDLREDALAARRKGAAIVAGDPAASLAVALMRSTDPQKIMPPPDSERHLSPAQIDLLEKWIAQGAEWKAHWAFEAPRRPELPAPVPASGVHPIDRLIHQKLAALGLGFSPSADPARQVRRLHLDLTGLPPHWETVADLMRDPSEQAWEKLVDEVLASPAFGERMAMFWLDAARYSDTDGFQHDATRQNWPWRDWVVQAFNANQPFDRFTIEQFAGDLLENAAPEQKLATAFHRHHMTNGEGGRDPEESRIDYVLDRVNTLGTVWLGLTLSCSQCHSHKFDPVSQAEYYSLTAFFNSIDEDGRAGDKAGPYLPYRAPQAEAALQEARQWLESRKQLEARAADQAEGKFQEWLSAQMRRRDEGFSAWHAWRALSMETTGGTQLAQQDDDRITAGGREGFHEDYLVAARPGLKRLTGLKLEVLPVPDRADGGWSRSESGDFVLTDLKVRVQRAGEPEYREIRIEQALADHEADPRKHGGYGKIAHVLDDDPRNGWASYGAGRGEPLHAVFAFEEPLVLGPDEQLVVELQHRSLKGHEAIGALRLWVTDQPGQTPRSLGRSPLEELVASGAREPRDLDATLTQRLRRQFLEDEPSYQPAARALRQAQRQWEACRQAAGEQKVMVLAERAKPRDTHVLVRGEWDRKGEKVSRGVPGEILPWSGDLPDSRLGLAQWILHPDHPLTARVVVNHLWGLVFGDPLVRTPEDFGVQGERPDHPQLLDWLAVEFRESGWDVKHMIRLMVTSRAYRQSSDATELQRERDPDNRLLARASRFRLPSWVLRDAAMQSAGLLNGRLGGPPVYPPQPAGVWEDITMGRFRYEPSEGPARYRRTLYAFWRRSSAPAFLFDVGDRRVCSVRAVRTNTPLQALALLNNPERWDAAVALGDIAEQLPRAEDRWKELYRRVLSREPGRDEIDELNRLYHQAITAYRTAPDQAAGLLKLAGERPAPADPVERAALAVVANLVLNLDEAISRE